MWDRLIAVVEEQAQTLIRIGFSTSTREAGDVSAGVFDTAGRMLAQAITGTPGHVNSMARAVGSLPDGVPGDHHAAGRHLHHQRSVERHRASPRLHGGDPGIPGRRLVALFASTCHVIDIGGRGMGPEARQVFEEGLYIPIMRFASASASTRP